MKCTIKVYCLNQFYSQEIADRDHNGLPSEDNREFDWEDELKVSSHVESADEKIGATYVIAGEMGDGNSFSYDVTNMRLVEIVSSDAPVLQVGVSESILNEVAIEQIQDELFVSFFINDYEPLANPIPGVYIASKEFPKELIHA